ncbi:MAG: DUF5723 family protein [Salibacteraceae bacterium]|nr:DUF5723 family protein [Salibacteraceae bacterium]
MNSIFKIRYILLISFMLLNHLVLDAQEWIGTTIDNYTPVNSMLINPSAIVDQKPWLDVHLIGVGAHAANNFGYLENSRVLNFAGYQTGKVNLERTNGWAQVNAQILGPSASLSLGKQAIGLHTSIRSAISINKIPLQYARAFIERVEGDSTVFSVNNTRVKSLTWAEVGLSYGRILYQFDKDFLTGGITVNRLIGLQSATLFIDEGEMLVDNGQGTLLSGNGKYAYAEPAFTMGGGWSTSIGFTYKRMIDDVSSYVPHGKNVRCTTLPYKWKVSASLVDVGGVRVKRNGFYNKFDETDNSDDYLNVLEGGNGIDALPRDGDRYTAWLPMGLNTQFDFNLKGGIFFNALFSQRLSFPSSYGPDRSNLLAVTARYEKNWLMVALPLSLENYRDPHLGLAVRFWLITVGTEQVLPYFFKTDVYTADLYVHLRLRFFDAPGCRTPYFKGLKGFKFGNLFNPKAKDPASCPHW